MTHAQKAQETTKKKNVKVEKTAKPVNGRKLVELLPALGKPATKELIATSTRAHLDRYVVELTGKTPNKARTDDEVRAALVRWVDGEKNWGNVDAKPESAKPESAKPESAKPESAKSESAKSESTKPAPEKKSKSKPKPKAEEGERILGRTTGMTRAAFFLDMLTKNRKEKLTDDVLLAKAIAEFGEEHVPGPTNNFTPSHRRTVYNLDRKHGRRGLTMSTPEFVGYGKTKNGKKEAAS